MRNKSKYIIIILIFFISIGFAYLSTNLYISGTSIVKRSAWDVHFNNIQNETCTYQIDSNASISSNSKQVDFTFTFEKPGDSYSFNVDVVNTGNIDAMLESYNVAGLPNEASYLEWNVLYDDGIEFNKYDLLAANSTDTIVVTVNFKEDVDINDLPTGADTSFDLKFIVKYVQADNNATTRESGTYTITYNLDGGTISNYPTTYTVRSGAILPTPTKEGYDFGGWTGGKNIYDVSTNGYNTGATERLEIDDEIVYKRKPSYNSANIWPNIYNTQNYEEDETYTISMDIWADTATTFNMRLFYLNNATSTTHNLTEISTTRTRLIATYTYKSSTGTSIHIYPSIGLETSNGIYISKVQVEKGSKPTEWEPYNYTNRETYVEITPGMTGNRTYTANWIEN